MAAAAQIFFCTGVTQLKSAARPTLTTTWNATLTNNGRRGSSTIKSPFSWCSANYDPLTRNLAEILTSFSLVFGLLALLRSNLTVNGSIFENIVQRNYLDFAWLPAFGQFKAWNLTNGIQQQSLNLMDTYHWKYIMSNSTLLYPVVKCTSKRNVKNLKWGL